MIMRMPMELKTNYSKKMDKIMERMSKTLKACKRKSTMRSKLIKCPNQKLRRES